MLIDWPDVIEIARGYEQEIRSGEVKEGLRGALERVKNKIDLDFQFNHLYVFHRIKADLKSYAFYQIPYSEIGGPHYPTKNERA